jgi:hypothetical protein
VFATDNAHRSSGKKQYEDMWSLKWAPLQPPARIEMFLAAKDGLLIITESLAGRRDGEVLASPRCMAYLDILRGRSG